ncbi:hypothetical protein ACJZTR_00450 [Neorickettsia risticii]
MSKVFVPEIVGIVIAVGVFLGLLIGLGQAADHAFCAEFFSSLEESRKKAVLSMPFLPYHCGFRVPILMSKEQPRRVFSRRTKKLHLIPVEGLNVQSLLYGQRFLNPAVIIFGIH